MVDIRFAIEYKYPDLIFRKDFDVVDGVVDWKTDKYTKPTNEEIELWGSQLLCRIKRAKEYALLKEQMDSFWHDIDNGLFGEEAKTGGLYLGNKSVKDANIKIVEEN